MARYETNNTTNDTLDIFAEGGLETLKVQHTNLENLSVDREESAKLYSKTKATAEKLGINDLFSRAGTRIEAVVKMLSYEEFLGNQKEIVYMTDENKDKVFENYKNNMQEIAPEIPQLARHYVLLETLQTMFRESMEQGNVVFFEDSQGPNGRTEIRPEEATAIAALTEVMRVDYLVNFMKPNELNEDYARPLNNIRKRMDSILNQDGSSKGTITPEDVQEIFSEMVESMKFIGSRGPDVALNEVHASLMAAQRLMPENAIRYNPLDEKSKFSIDASKLEPEKADPHAEDKELIKKLDELDVTEVYSEKTKYSPRDMYTREKSNYDIREIGREDFQYYVRALVKVNAEGLVKDQKKFEQDIDLLTTQNEAEGGYLSRIGFIVEALTPLEGASKADLVKLAAAYVAKKEMAKLAEENGVAPIRVPLLRQRDAANPERQAFADQLTKLDGVFDRLFDNQLEEQEVAKAKREVLNGIHFMRKAELRWHRADLTEDNLATEFPGVLSFVEKGADKLPWGRKIVSKDGKAVLRGANVADGFPINE